MQDTTPPVISIPADVTVECDQSTDPANTGSATATDTCDTAPNVSFSDSVAPGDCPQESIITRTWTATDGCGNSSSGVQIINVQDTTPPAIMCNAPATIFPKNVPISFTATTVDNCDDSSMANISAAKCTTFTKRGKLIDKNPSCEFDVDGDTITIVDSGGVGTFISWTLNTSDSCGNESDRQCSVEIVNPKKVK